MIITEGTPLGFKALIIDKRTFQHVPRLKWFNTETKECEMYVTLYKKELPFSILPEIRNELFFKLKEEFMGKGEDDIYPPVTKYLNTSIVAKDENDKLITVKCFLKDCAAYNRETGEEII